MESNISRLQLVQNQLSAKAQKAQPYVESSWDYLKMDEHFPKEVIEFRKELRVWLENEVKPHVTEAYEKAEFPEIFVKKFAEHDLIGKFLAKPYGEGYSVYALGAAVVEIARIDASLATFFLVDLGLCAFTIESFGSEEQKAKYMPLMRQMKIVGGWGLTEEDLGSDASSLKTSVQKVEGGYRLNGNKRWIGNGNRDIVVVWARNTENKKIEAFIVPIKNNPGFTSEVIKNKLALRIVQNCQLRFDNVFIPEENKLPKAKDFTSTGEVLLHSRLFVAWLACGIAVGIYDNVIKYVDQRKQFGVKIASFQLIQDKLVKIMGNVQGMLYLTLRMTQLYEQKKATIGMIAMTKAWCTRLLREAAALGREALGGNGIILDNYAMKALADAEAIYTYEGTYDINSLVCSRELTGISAFKAGK